MIIKAIILIMIVVISTLIGFQYAETIKGRVKDLNSIMNSVVYLQNEIFYRLTPLSEAMCEVADKVDDPVSSFYKDVSRLLYDDSTPDMKSAFTKAIDINKDKFSLDKEDYSILIDFSSSLGATDIDGQMKIFDITIYNLKKNLKIAEDKAEKNVKMYRVLGLCIGLMIAIFLV